MYTYPCVVFVVALQSRDAEVTGFTERVARLIEEQDPELAKDIAKQFVTTKGKSLRSIVEKDRFSCFPSVNRTGSARM